MECSLKSVPDLLIPHLLDPAVTDLCLNGPLQFMIDRGAGLEPVLSEPIFRSDEDYRQFILEQLSLSGKTWDAKLPFVDTVFFKSHRAHLAFPPVAQNGIYLSLRRLPTPSKDPLDVAQKKSESRWKDSSLAFDTLKACVQNHETILFAGATGSGKTTLFSDLLCFASPRERLVALEDTAEIKTEHPHFIGLLSRTANADGFGAVTLRDLVKQTLRMRPDRILIGECRGDEVLDLLLALNTGHKGTLATIHANSATDAIKRLELLALIASKGQIPSPLIKNLIASGIQKIVFLKRIGSQRKIEEIISIAGHERDVIYTRPVYPSDQAPRSARSLLENHRETPSPAHLRPT
jgi:pilus assembly protein CpaF